MFDSKQIVSYQGVLSHLHSVTPDSDDSAFIGPSSAYMDNHKNSMCQ